MIQSKLTQGFRICKKYWTIVKVKMVKKSHERNIFCIGAMKQIFMFWRFVNNSLIYPALNFQPSATLGRKSLKKRQHYL